MAAAVQCDNCGQTSKQEEMEMDPLNPWYQVFVGGEGFDLCGPDCGVQWMQNEVENMPVAPSPDPPNPKPSAKKL